MGRTWDKEGIAFNKKFWEKCLRVVKPGGHIFVFGFPRTFHRVMCAIEDAGFEIRDTIVWMYGQGFAKAMNIGLAVDKARGNNSKVVAKGKGGATSKAFGCDKTPTDGEYNIYEAQNEFAGWETTLKPAFEPIIMARKPVEETIVENIEKYKTGGLNIDECRIPLEESYKYKETNRKAREDDQVFNNKNSGFKSENNTTAVANPKGRYPSNLIFSYDEKDKQELMKNLPSGGKNGDLNKEYDAKGYIYGDYNKTKKFKAYNDEGSVLRYFYCAKSSKLDRDNGIELIKDKKLEYNNHPTIKPCDLMCYLVRMINYEGATILDPFMGSGSTGKAVVVENRLRNKNYKFIGIEKDRDYCEIAKARIEWTENIDLDYINDNKRHKLKEDKKEDGIMGLNL